MEKLLIDTNIIIDLLTKRENFYKDFKTSKLPIFTAKEYLDRKSCI
jgi:predicted nucleic acid-binding protein